MREFKADRGFLTLAQGNDYLHHARAQAMSIKLTQKTVRNFAVIVDETAAKDINDDDRSLFDAIIELPRIATDWDMSQEHKVFALTPWRETIKTDADMLFPASIDHWWPHLQSREVCITSEVRDFRNDVITSRQHRRLFDENLLPNVYSALTYFRYSQLAGEFFQIARQLTNEWEWIAKEHLIKNQDLRLRTDEMYALAARIVGEEKVTWPASFPTFVHMKEEINKLSTMTNWYEQIPCYWENKKLFVGNYQQHLPFHYHKKGMLDHGTYQRINRDYREFLQSS